MRSASVWRHFDLWLTAAVLLLTAYGILAINSAITGAPAFETYPQRQLIFAIAGLVMMVIIAAIDYRILTSSHWYIYGVLIAALVFVALAGAINNDSRRWISLGFIQIQPSLSPTRIPCPSHRVNQLNISSNTWIFLLD